MLKPIHYSFIINVLVMAVILYLQFGPIKLWKKVILQNGDISWLYFAANMGLLLLISAFVVTSISLFIKEKEPISPEDGQVDVPNFQIQLTDDLYNDNELKKPGKFTYHGLISLPIGDQIFLKDVLINIKFPIIIEKFDIINDIGSEQSKIHLGPDNIIEFSKQTGFKTHSKKITIEIGKLKPGAFFRFKAVSITIADRNINRDIDYNGYFYYDFDNETFKEDIDGKFRPKYYKLATMNLKKYEKLLKFLKDIDPKQGTFYYWTSDPRWFIHNGFFIDFIPSLKKENFEVKIFRDKDNIFKCKLTTYYFNDILLQFKDIDELPNKPKHPRHMVLLTWGPHKSELYIDGELVDSYYINNTQE